MYAASCPICRALPYKSRQASHAPDCPWGTDMRKLFALEIPVCPNDVILGPCLDIFSWGIF